jgi:hypothetical protein
LGDNGEIRFAFVHQVRNGDVARASGVNNGMRTVILRSERAK